MYPLGFWRARRINRWSTGRDQRVEAARTWTPDHDPVVILKDQSSMRKLKRPGQFQAWSTASRALVDGPLLSARFTKKKSYSNKHLAPRHCLQEDRQERQIREAKTNPMIQAGLVASRPTRSVTFLVHIHQVSYDW